MCGLCGNNCQLTINTFADGATFISGNRCDRPVTGKADTGERNLYEYKRKLILGYKPVPGRRGKIGLPLCLNMWELLPFWHTLLHQAGLRGVPQPLLQPGPVSEGAGHHPQRHGLLPGQVGPRSYPVPRKAWRWTRSSTPA